MILSLSVPTCLPPRSFDANPRALVDGRASGGRLYVTVRHQEFLDHKRAEALRGELARRLGAPGLGRAHEQGEAFGDSIVTEAFLARFGPTRYLGTPHPLQHVHAFDH